MKIPVLNFYYLLCYAWDMLEEGQLVDVANESFRSLPDLFARVLATGMTHLLKRGLDRSYLTELADTRTLRGKLDLTTTVKRNLFLKSSVHCVYDELSHDVLHNRIIKATLSRLARCDDLDRGLRNESLRIYRHLHEVSEVELTTEIFDRVVVHRNNRLYGFLIEVCRILHGSLLADSKGGKSEFRDFLRDDRLMAGVFEKFVRNFYRREQAEFKVHSEQIAWQNLEGEPSHLAYLPMMRTDLSLDSPDRKIVIDTKYYANSLQSYRGGKTIHSQNLYQLFAYLKNLEPTSPPDQRLEGILLYPTVDTGLDLRFSIHGYRLHVATVDLNVAWPDIRSRLLSIID